MTPSTELKSKIRRFFPAFLVLAMLLPTVLASCSGSSGKTTVPATAAPSSSTAVLPTFPAQSTAAPSSSKKPADELFDAVPAYDYGEAEFRIAAYHSKNIFPSSAGDIIDDLALERNLKVEDKFNVRLTQVSLPANDFFNSLKSDYLSGLPGCDLVIAPADLLDYFVTFSMYTNVNTLGVDFTKPCYNKSAMDAMTTGVITYAAAGSLTDSPEDAYCVFLNRTLLRELGGEELTRTVLDGKWTWASLGSLSSAAAKKNGYYGLCGSVDDKTFINLFWASTGVHFFTNEPPLNPQIALDSASASGITKLISGTINGGAYYNDKAKQTKNAYDLFSEGKCLFYISRISQFTSLRSSGISVGVLPLPKFNEEQSDYSSYIDNTFQVTYVPVNCPDRARAGVILDALSTSSYNMVNNAYLSLYMHIYLSSNDEALIVNKVFESQFFDIGFVLGPVYNQFASASFDMIYRAVTAGASLSTMIRQNKTQLSRFPTNKIFDYPKEPETTAAPPSSEPAATVSATLSPPAPASSGAPTAPPTTAKAPSAAPASTSARTSAPLTSSSPSTSKTPGTSFVPPTSPASTSSVLSGPSGTVTPSVPASSASESSGAGGSSSAASSEPAVTASETVTPSSGTASPTSQAPESTSPDVTEAPPVSTEAAPSAEPQPSSAPAQTVPAE